MLDNNKIYDVFIESNSESFNAGTFKTKIVLSQNYEGKTDF